MRPPHTRHEHHWCMLTLPGHMILPADTRNDTMTSSHRTRYCRCGARLARDNTSTRCSACIALDRDRLCTAPEVPADFWDEVVLREALLHRHMGRVIRAWRTHPHHGRHP